MNKRKIIWLGVLVLALVAAIYSVYFLTTRDQRRGEKAMKISWQEENEKLPAINYGQWTKDINDGFIKNFFLKEKSWKRGDRVAKEEFHILLTYQNGETVLGEVPAGTTRSNILDIYNFAQFKVPPILYQESIITEKESLWKKFDFNNITNVAYLVFFIAVAIASLYTLYWITHRGGIKLSTYQSNVTFDDVETPPGLLRFSDEIAGKVKRPLIFSLKGGKMPHGFFFSGPPGTGKSLSAAALANKLSKAGVLCYKISCTNLLEATLGDPGAAAARIGNIFKGVRSKKQPCLLIFDEIHVLFEKPELDVAVSQLLGELSGLEGYEASAYKENKLTANVVVLAITNKPGVTPKAFLRRGRIGRIVEFSLPTLPARMAILRIHSRDKDIPAEKKEEWLDWLAKKTDGFSGDDLREVLENAANRCADRIDNKIKKGELVIPDDSCLNEPVKLKDFLREEKITFSDIQSSFHEIFEEKQKAA